MIEQCLTMCECLTIGVISDDIIRERKKHEPAVFEKYRYMLLDILYPHCDVILFNGKPDKSFYNQFDVIFVSSALRGKKFYFIPDDYKGNVVYILYTEGISSTSIRHNLIFGMVF